MIYKYIYIFYHSLGCNFTWWRVSFDAQIFKIVSEVQSVYFPFCRLHLWSHIQEPAAKSHVVQLLPYVVSKDFTVLAPPCEQTATLLRVSGHAANNDALKTDFCTDWQTDYILLVSL